jgi:hypothetical protein
MLSILVVVAVLAPRLTPEDPLAQNRTDRFQSPSLAPPFGTEFGRDILSRVIHDARISLFTGAVAMLIGGTVGVPLGLGGGFAGGVADAAITRVLDFLLAVPAILLAMVIVVSLGSRLVQRDAGGRRGEHPLVRTSGARPSTLTLIVDRPMGDGLQCHRDGRPDILARHPPGAFLQALAADVGFRSRLARRPRHRPERERGAPMTDPSRAPVPIFRWSGTYWGFVEHDRLYDRHGRQVGRVEPVPGRGPDVFEMGGRFLGELFARHYVMRHALRDEPVHHTPRVRTLHPAPPDPAPARDRRIPLDDWTDALPWPLPPPDPPAR